MITAALGIFLIGYSVFKHFTGIGFNEKIEKYVFDGVIFGALGLFIYNRKMHKDEKVAQAAKEEAERKAAEPQEEADSPEDENLPHWERYKSDN